MCPVLLQDATDLHGVQSVKARRDPYSLLCQSCPVPASNCVRKQEVMESLGSDSIARRSLAADTAAARRNGALRARVSKGTHGHDICSADPWVFGFTFSLSPLQWGSLAYHLKQKAMQVAANTVLAELDTTR